MQTENFAYFSSYPVDRTEKFNSRNLSFVYARRFTYFADFCDLTVSTNPRKSLPFAASVDWESLRKFGGEDVLQ